MPKPRPLTHAQTVVLALMIRYGGCYFGSIERRLRECGHVVAQRTINTLIARECVQRERSERGIVYTITDKGRADYAADKST